MTQEPANLYQVLGVERQATIETIEAAYAALRLDGLEEADEATKERIQYAYEVLSNPQRRSLYDSLVAETAAPTLSLEVIPSSDRLAITDTPQLLYLLVHIRPQGSQEERHQPLNLSLVLDRSTSMRGERLEKVLAAVRLLTAKLGPEDVVSVVSFSDRAEVNVPAAAMALHAQNTPSAKSPQTAAAEEALFGTLDLIAASGGTEIYQGLAAGVGQIRQVDLSRFTNHLILLTDGHTYGDAPECLALAQQAADAGIGFSAFGIGADWNDKFLDELVAPSGGQSGYIEDPGEIITYLESRIRGLGAVYARDVRLQPKWPRQMTALECFKLSPFAQPLSLDGGSVALGHMEGRAPLSLLLELQVEPQPVPARIKIPVTVTAVMPAENGKTTKANTAEQSFSTQVQLMVMKSGTGKSGPTPEMVEAVRLLTLHRMHEKAWNEAETGQLQAAATRMQQLTTRLLESGELDLAQQAHLEAQRIARLGTMSLEGRKILKYGTRSLLGQKPK